MSTSKNNGVVNFYKLFIIQIYGYLALIPFIFGFLSLYRGHSTRDIIVFLIGLLFILVLLVLNHLEPLIKITENRIILFNIDRNKPIILIKKNITKIVKINDRLAKLYIGSKFYEIRLSRKQLKRFLQLMEIQ